MTLAGEESVPVIHNVLKNLYSSFINESSPRRKGKKPTWSLNVRDWKGARHFTHLMAMKSSLAVASWRVSQLGWPGGLSTTASGGLRWLLLGSWCWLMVSEENSCKAAEDEVGGIKRPFSESVQRIVDATLGVSLMVGANGDTFLALKSMLWIPWVNGPVTGVRAGAKENGFSTYCIFHTFVLKYC